VERQVDFFLAGCNRFLERSGKTQSLRFESFIPKISLEGTVLSQKGLAQLDVVALFHSVLFSYQTALRDVLGQTASSVIIFHAVPTIETILGKASPELASAVDADDALRRFAKLLMASGLVERVEVKEEPAGYTLVVDGCSFAEHVHGLLNPKDVTCPWGIIAASAVQRISKRSVRMSLSEFSQKGSKTPIELKP
jgi:hypothetical protein